MNEQKTEEQKPKTLDDEVKFSWMRVAKNGIKNMKDDIDPIYKGAKIGVYSLHGIATWAREYKDGRLANSSNWWSTISAAFVLGTTGTAYYIATNEAVERHGLKGYAVLAIPLASQAASYTREAFRKAKKSEMNNVIQMRIQKRLNNESTEKFDLSLKDMVDAYTKSYAPTQRVRNAELRDLESARERQKLNSNTAIEAYSTIGEAAENIFNELFAHNQVGKTYESYRDLTMVNKSNENKRKFKRINDYISQSPEGFVEKLIWEKVSEKGGSANIELLGKVTAIYTGEGHSRQVRYRVEPDKLWKR